MRTRGGPGANQIGNDWFKAHRGRDIVVIFGDWKWKGKLVRWDNYNILLDVQGRDILIKQAPGMEFAEPKETRK